MNDTFAASTAHPTGSLYGLSRVEIGPYRNHYTSLRPMFDADEGGGGSEGDGGGGGDEEYGLSEFDTDQKDDAGNAVKAKAHAFKKDTALVMLPGMKKPMTVRDLAAALASKTQYEGGLRTMGEIAKALKAQQADPARGKKADAGRGADGGDRGAGKGTRDVLEALEQEGLLEGKTVAAVLREFRDGTVSPMVKVLVALAKRVEGLEGHAGTVRQRDAETDFGGEVTSAVAALKLPRVGDAPIEGESILAEIARDIYHSYDPEDQPKLRGEVFSKLVKERFDALAKFFKAYQKAELAAAQSRMREKRFARPGAGTSANGKPRRMPSNREVADILFAQAGAEG